MNVSLRRISSEKIIEELDGLRFIAIFMVILLHIQGIWLRYNPSLYTSVSANSTFKSTIGILCHGGVQLFFVISGFILALPWTKSLLENKELPSIKKFYKRRLTRLEPPFILLSIFLLFAIVYTKNVSFKEIMPHFWATIFYVHNFVFGYGSKINVASWSLEIEVQFYLLVPFLLPLIFKVIQKNRYVLVALIVIYPIILFQFIDYNHTGLHRFFHYFLAGIVWCYIYLKTDFLKSTSFYYDVLLIFTLLMHVFVVFNWGQILPAQVSLFLNHNFLPITIFVLFMTCFKGTYFNKFLKIPFISIVGSMCYSIYLIHGFIITLVILLVKKHLHFGSYILDFVALAFIISPVVLFCCSIFYVFLERPFMDKDWPNKLIGFFRAKTQNNKL